MPWKDAAIVVDESGTGTSRVLAAVYLHNFSVLCDALATWSYEINDSDGYPITSLSDQGMSTITGPAAIPVARKTKDVVFTIKNATQGLYNLRAFVD